MPWLDDLSTILKTAYPIYNVAGVVHFSSKAGIPSGAGPYFLFIATGGSSPDGTQDNPVAYQFPGAQVQVRAATHPAARDAAKNAWTAVSKVRNRVVNGTFYRSITMLQSEPFDLGLDDSQRIIMAFNVLGDRRSQA